MRVLLPLRKQATNKQSSNENLVQLEYAELESDTADQDATTSSSESVLTLRVESSEPPTTDSLVTSSPDLQLDACGHTKNLSISSDKPAWKTTGLTETDRIRSTVVPRKRPRPIVEDSRKRPAWETKPPAKLTGKMGLGTPHRKSNAWYGNSTTGRPLLIRNHRPNDDNNDNDDNDSDDNDNNPTKGRFINDERFAMELKKRGLEIQEQEGDGNCLFRAVSLQVYGDPSMHGQVRKQCMDFMMHLVKERDKEHFSQFVPDEDFPTYIHRKRQDGVHGNNPEIQAISELFNRPIEVYSPENGVTPLNIFHTEYKTDDVPIRLSYHDGNHYNAVVDPLVPTAGLGLGLPGLQPGLADKMQMAKAVVESDATADQMELEKALKESQDDELQRAIKESKLSAEHMHSHEAMELSDVDATYFELEQAALEHSLETHMQLEHGKKQRASPTQEQKGVKTSFIDNNTMSLSHMDPTTPPLVAVASLPISSTSSASEAHIPEVAAAVASVASVASTTQDDLPAPIRSVDEYPPVVQELVMNGFDIVKVVRAVEFIGENFDDLLAFLMSSMG